MEKPKTKRQSARSKKEQSTPVKPVSRNEDIKSPSKVGLPLRERLQRDKIFFETIAALALSIMALVVSVSQFWTMLKQTEYIEQQTMIQRQEAIPNFVLSTDLVFDGDIAEGENIVIENRGGLAYDITCKTAVFLITKILGQDMDVKETEIPVETFYDVQIYGDTATGVVLTLRGFQNNLLYSQLYHEFMGLAEKNNVSGNLSIQRYVTISYRDVFDDYHVDYFLVEAIIGGHRLDSREGQEIFERHSAGRLEGNLFQFYDLTAEKLFELATK